MENKRTIKVSNEFYEFMKKVIINRIKTGADTEPINLNEVPEIIVKYFKLNNDKYIELAKLEWK